MNFKPLSDRVVIKRLEASGKSSGGIILTSEPKSNEGIVVAVGPGKKFEGNLIPSTLEVGDRVVFGRIQVPEIELNSEKFVLLHETDILGVFKD